MFSLHFYRTFTSRLHADDYPVAHHLVHEHRILPGVYLIDLIYRVCFSLNIEPQQLELKKCVFLEPVSMGPNSAPSAQTRIIKLEIKGTEENRATVTISSQADSEQDLDSRRHLSAQLTYDASFAADDEMAMLPNDITKGALVNSNDADHVYAFARKVDIEHKDFMKAQGQIGDYDDCSIAKVKLSPLAQQAADDFMVHPVFLDFATLVPFSKHQDSYQHAYIPLYIESFKILKLPVSECYVYHKDRNDYEPIDDIIYHDLFLYDDNGEPSVILKRFGAKKIRHENLIHHLTQKNENLPKSLVSNVAINEAPVAGSEADIINNDLSLLLKKTAGKFISLVPEDISLDTTFYELGLSSSDLLDMVSRLEDDLSIELYPTLLFEYSTINTLTEYLIETTSVLDAFSKNVAGTHSNIITDDAAQSVDEIADIPADKNTRGENTSPEFSPFSSHEASSHETIAIVGLAGRYPQSDNLHEFWENIIAGKDCVEEIPQARWSMDDFYDAQGEKGKSISKWGSFIDGFKEFDPLFFGISPLDAEQMDPQERLFLQVAWHALEDAGMSPDSPNQQQSMGVFCGAMWNDYQLFGYEEQLKDNPVLASSWFSSLSNRVSYCFNLNGPSLSLDTACSSALYAVHLACDSIRKGECETALCGAVNLSLHPSKYTRLSTLNMLSPNGRCHAFGDQADGYVPGEGVGAILLKPLAHAQRDGNPIYGVVRGSSIAHGGKTAGFSVPSASSQSSAFITALDNAKLLPTDLSYLEAHGTGTRLGDPIEVEGVDKTFQHYGYLPQEHSLYTGSLKSNLGHLESAAGIASISKVLLSMHYHQLPMSLHTQTLNPLINFTKSALKPLQSKQDWPKKSRHAAVASFGAGGSNSYLIIEDYTSSRDKEKITSQNLSDQTHWIAVSARSKSQLQEWLNNLSLYIERSEPENDLAALAHSFQQGRKTHGHRWLAQVSTLTELKNCLRASLNESSATLPRLACAQYYTVQKGQNAALDSDHKQHHGYQWLVAGHAWPVQYPVGTKMLPLLPSYPFMRSEYWVETKKEEGVSLVNWALEHRFHPPTSAENTAQTKTSIPVEYSVVPGMASFEWLLNTVNQTQEPREYCVANLSWWQPLTLAMLKQSDPVLEQQDKQLKLRHQQQLICSVDFLTDKKEIKDIHRQTVAIDFTAAKKPLKNHLSKDAFYQQLQTQGIEYGDSLQMVEEIHYEQGAAFAKLRQAQCLTQLLDAALQCSSVLLHSENGQMKLPFKVEKLWLSDRHLEATQVLILAKDDNANIFDVQLLNSNQDRVGMMAGFILKPTAGVTQKKKHSMLAYQPHWLLVPGQAATVATTEGVCLVVTTEFTYQAWQESPPEAFKNKSCLFVITGDAFSIDGNVIHTAMADYNQVGQLIDVIAKNNRENNTTIAQLVVTPLGGNTSEIECLLNLLCHWHKLKQKSQSRWVFVHTENEKVKAQGVASLAKTVTLEMPKVRLKSVEIDADHWHNNLNIGLKELQESSGCYVRYSDGDRYEQRMLVNTSATELPAISFRHQGNYIITGGMGGLGQLFCRFLRERFSAKVTLVGRRALNTSQQQILAELNHLPTDQVADNTTENVQYVVADMIEPDDVATLFKRVYERFGALHGFIHSAGVIHDALLPFKQAEKIQQVLQAKIGAVQLLKQQLNDTSIDFVLLCSSVSATLGSVGQADYAAANGFMDGFAAEHHLPQQPWISVNWPLWRDGGMQVGDNTQTILEKAGLFLLETEQGLDALTIALAKGQSQVMLVPAKQAQLEQRLQHVEHSELAVTTVDKTVTATKMHRQSVDTRKPLLPPYSVTTATDASTPEQGIAIEQTLIELLATQLKLQLSDVVSNEPFESYGIDSIQTVNFLESIENVYPVSILVTEFKERNTIDLLADYISQQLVRSSAALSSIVTQVVSASDTPAEETKESRDVGPPNHPSENIAIIAVAGSFPGADGLDALWQVLRDDDNTDRVKPLAYNSLCRRRGYPELDALKEYVVYALDESEFNTYKPDGNQASSSVLSHQILIYLADQLVKGDQSKNGETFAESQTAVYLGLSANEPIRDAESLEGMMASSAASILSQRYGFQGPSMVIDTACSSSMAAIHQACESLKSGQVKAALCGGLTLLSNPHAMVAMNNKGMLSTDGSTRIFDEQANGFALGEGAGLLLLKTEAQAHQDGDRIIGLIKASCMVNEGEQAALPNPKILRHMVQQTQQYAKLNTEDIGYVEMSGVGDQLIDVLELETLRRSYESQQPFTHSSVGSSKSYYGSLLHASGVLSLFKSLLCLQHESIPVQPNVSQQGRRFPLDESLSLASTRRSWAKKKDISRVAVINNMGMGGTHVHLALCEGRDTLPQKALSPTSEVQHVESAITPPVQQDNTAQQWCLRLLDWVENTINYRPDTDASFDMLGLESINIVALMECIEAEINDSLSPSIFFDNPTITGLATHLAERYGAVVQADNHNITKPVVDASTTTTDDQVTPKKVLDNHNIAITGMAVKLPAAENLHEFWQMIHKGEGVVGVLTRPLADTTTNSKQWHGGTLNHCTHFDAAFFGVSPREAELMDPQIRLALQVAYQAAEDAGIISTLKGSNTGVFAGITFRDYEHLIRHAQHADKNHHLDAHASTGNAATMLANRLSHFFNLTGPSVVIDTACSASLVAVHQACHAIRMGDCEQAIVLGTNLLLSQQHFSYMDALGALSTTGQCFTFDQRADGYVPGEAIVAIVIQSESLAIAQGDRRYANIIGSAVNHAGLTNSITVPSASRQQQLLNKAWNQANITASDLGYLETHGTGTPLGDPIEVDALTAAISVSEKETLTKTASMDCVLGSVKSNIGHTEAAAGLVGLVKAALVVHQGWRPPQAHFSELNKKIYLPDCLHIQSTGEAWNKTIEHRLAGVSSFGFGGTNAHAVLAGHRCDNELGKDQPLQKDSIYWIPVSSKTTIGLYRQTQGLANYIKQSSHAPDHLMIDALHLSSIASTLQCREAMTNRVVFIADSIASFLNILDHFNGQQQASGQVYGLELTPLTSVAESWISTGAQSTSSASVRVYLPNYLFESQPYWLDGVKNPDADHSTMNNNAPLVEQADKSCLCLFNKTWQAEALIAADFSDEKINPNIRVYGSKSLLSRLPSHFNASALDDYLNGNENTSSHKQSIILMYEPLPGEQQVLPVFALVKKALGQCTTTAISLVVVINKDAVCAEDSMLFSLAYAANSIHPRFSMRCIAGNISSSQLHTEVISQDNLVNVVYRNGQRGFYTYQPLDTSNTLLDKPGFGFKQSGVYLITGGMGEIAQLFARYLAQTYHAKIILCGRRPLSTTGYQKKLEQLNVIGAQAIYIQADCSDKDAMGRVVLYAQQRFKILDGILHLAGHVNGKSIIETTEEDVISNYNTKLSSLRFLSEFIEPLKNKPWLCAFSSTSTLLPSSQMVDYSMANAAMDTQCEVLQQKGLPVFSLQLPYWESGGLSMSPEQQKLLEEHTGFSPMPATAGIELLQQIVKIGLTNNIFVGYGKKQHIKKTLDAAVRSKRINGRNVSATLKNDNEEEKSVPVNASTEQLKALLVDVLRLRSTPDDETPLIDLGFESITVLEFVDRANKDMGLQLSGADVYSFPTVGRLLAYGLQQTRKSISKTPEPTVQSQPNNKDKDDILLVGMAGRFPGANNITQFWENQLNAKNTISQSLPSRMVGDDVSATLGGGFLDNVSRFDAEFFDMHPAQAQQTDPQQRLLLEACWHALEDAGIPPSDLVGEKVGVFVGVSNVEYKTVAASATTDDNVSVSGHNVAGMSLSMVANRLSYLYNWTGPSESIDTGCSSSLVALHHARQSIERGECDWAMVAGVNLLLDKSSFQSCVDAGMLSADNRCSTFSEDANGYVRGEGIGIVLLQGPNVSHYPTSSPYARLVATGISHGGKGHSLTAPNAMAQSSLLHSIYQQDNINVEHLDYIECHGTATPLGDPVEINGLKQAFLTLKKQPLQCGLGTIKTHIGHLEPAAGIAGIIRTALAIKHQMRPGNLHFKKLNAHIQLKNTPFYIQDNNTPWPDNGTERLAGVSSFGFGGVNGHSVLASCEAKAQANFSDQYRNKKGNTSPVLLRWSAKTKSALHALLNEFSAWLEVHPNTCLYSLAMTLQHHRQPHGVRAVLEADSIAAAIQALSTWQKGDVQTVLIATEESSVILSRCKESCGHWENSKQAMEWLSHNEQVNKDKKDQKNMDYYIIRIPSYPFANTEHWPPISSPKKSEASKKESNKAVNTNSKPASAEVSSVMTYDEVRSEIMGLFSKVTQKPIDATTTDAYFDDIEIDSISNIALLDQIEQRFGKVSKTFLFEYQTIATISQYLQQRGVPSSVANDNAALAPASSPMLKAETQDNRVAIIGLSGQFPQSDNVEELWQLLFNESCAITEIPKDRFDWESFFGDPQKQENKSNSKWGGFTSNVNQFAADFFGISPLEAQALDPQQRLFLSHCFYTLEHAGYKLDQLKGSRTGVFVGVSTTDYGHVAAKVKQSSTMHTAVGMSHAMVANRISYLFDFSGPSEAVDTACSSSLVAINRAINALQQGECNLALAGGVNVILDEQLFIAFGQSGFLSPTGRCHSFSDKADGYVRGEGVGVVALKLLSEAEKDGDCILATIEASLVNHGGKVRSATIPNPNAQADLIARTWRKAGISPQQMDYVEAHGTGTNLGDPIEIQGLNAALATWPDQDQASNIEVGSIKANIGHLESGAGISGLIKLVLCLQNQWLPGIADFHHANPLLDIDDSSLSLLTDGHTWLPQAGRPRRAALSSFGFGGTNAHLVVSDIHDVDKTPFVQDEASAPALFIPISTHSQALTTAYIHRLYHHLEALPKPRLPPLAAIAKALSHHDTRQHRVLFCCTTSDQLMDLLQQYLSQTECSASLASGNAPCWFDSQQPLLDIDASLKAWLLGGATDIPNQLTINEYAKILLPPRPLLSASHWFKDDENVAKESMAIEASADLFETDIEAWPSEVPEDHWRKILERLNQGDISLADSVEELEL